MAIEDVSALILDDNGHMRALIRNILQGFGLRRIEEASNGRDAFDILTNGGIDVGFVDIRLANEDGLDFCRRVRSPTSPNIFLPIVMVTAYAERSRVLDAINVGVDEFLVKPVRAADVAKRLNAIIERRRPFVRSNDYFGPDRRRREDPRYSGPLRRATDPGVLSI